MNQAELKNDLAKSRNTCIQQLFRYKLPKYSTGLTRLFKHYEGVEDFLEEDLVPEVELCRILQNHDSLSYPQLSHILQDLYIAHVYVASNEFHALWEPYKETFSSFLKKHKYVRVWDEPTPSHLPDSLLVKYVDF